MENKDILFLALIIFFCVCSVTALIFNAHSKSRAPVFICAVSGILVIVFSVFLLIDRPQSNGRYVREYIPITSSEETKENQKGRKTHKSEKSSERTDLTAKSDDDTVFITRNGTKYHFSIDCGDYEFYECTLRQAKERGLEPCQKCAQ